MVSTPERISEAPSPEGVIEVPETPESTPEMEEAGVTIVPPQVTAQVTDDDSGQPLIQTPATKTVTVQIPTDPAKLDDWAKGSPANALTWFATFWLRMIKKAMHFGWKIIKREGA